MSDEVLQIDGDDRYARFRLIAWWDQDKLAAARVLVVGAGALGNEVLKNLALLGIGHVYIVDFDEIEESNLTRSVLFRSRDRGRAKAQAAAEALRDINPGIQVHAILGNIITDVGLGLFADVDVVIGCLDNREARLWVNRSCWKVNTPWIDGGIQEINGVAKVFVPPDGACYECAMTENDYRLISIRYSCPLLRQEDLLAGKVPTAPTISSMIGGLQTQEALKLIHGMPVAAGSAMVFNGIANAFYTTKYPHKEDCLSHDTWPPPADVPLTAAGATGSELFESVRDRVAGNGPLTIALERDLVVSIECAACGHSRRVMRPRQAVAMDEATCAECGELARPEMVHTVEENSPLAGERLIDLGIPVYDIVRITCGEAEGVFKLAGDRRAAIEDDGVRR
ncbi:MAG: HesA/MoeB/ThiF family protein [Planctomycetota bacterium]|jgi:adenylyltransferase/sulfurtransferase